MDQVAASLNLATCGLLFNKILENSMYLCPSSYCTHDVSCTSAPAGIRCIYIHTYQTSGFLSTSQVFPKDAVIQHSCDMP